MGLDTSHGAWHGPYSSFNAWRNQVARLAGYLVEPRTVSGHTCRVAQLDWSTITEDNLLGIWAETPPDPLMVLIAHSDCDGAIHPAQATPLADTLEAFLPRLDEYNRDITVRFIKGLRKAAANEETLLFR